MDKTDFIAIKDVRDGMKNINVMFIVLELTASTKTKENRQVSTFKVADQTACINCSIWDEPGKLLQPGDIVRMMKCYASIWRGCLNIVSSKSSEIIKMGDFCMEFNERLNMSKPVNVNSGTPPSALSPNNGTNRKSRFHPPSEKSTPLASLYSKAKSLSNTIQSPNTNSPRPRGSSSFQSRDNSSPSQSSNPARLQATLHSKPRSPNKNSSKTKGSSRFQPKNSSSPPQIILKRLPLPIPTRPRTLLQPNPKVSSRTTQLSNKGSQKPSGKSGLPPRDSSSPSPQNQRDGSSPQVSSSQLRCPSPILIDSSEESE